MMEKYREVWGYTLYDAVFLLSDGDRKTNDTHVSHEEFNSTVKWLSEMEKDFEIFSDRSIVHDDKRLF